MRQAQLRVRLQKPRQLAPVSRNTRCILFLDERQLCISVDRCADVRSADCLNAWRMCAGYVESATTIQLR